MLSLRVDVNSKLYMVERPPTMEWLRGEATTARLSAQATRR